MNGKNFFFLARKFIFTFIMQACSQAAWATGSRLFLCFLDLIIGQLARSVVLEARGVVSGLAGGVVTWKITLNSFTSTDSLRAAWKILLFHFLFYTFSFFYFLINTSFERRRQEDRCVTIARQRGSQASHRGHHPAGMTSKTNYVLQPINSNTFTTILLRSI